MKDFIYKLEKFEGPLDLLLQLIESAELDITEVSLAQVADQFIRYLGNVEQINPQELADFLVVAAKLLLIKSKMLLPIYHDQEDEDAARDLEAQLKIYREYYQAAQTVQSMIGEKKFFYAREKLPFSFEKIFNPPLGLTGDKMKLIFVQILKEIEPVVKMPEKTLKKVISLQDKISEIKNKILNKIELSFQDLISDSKSRTEIIVTFLGILELVKQRLVIVKQDENFSEIVVKKLI